MSKKPRRRESNDATSAKKFAVIEEKINKVYAMLEENHQSQGALPDPELNTSRSSTQPFPRGTLSASSHPHVISDLSYRYAPQSLGLSSGRIVTVIWSDAPFTSRQTFRSLDEGQVNVLLKSARAFTYGFLDGLEKDTLLPRSLTKDQPLLNSLLHLWP